VVEVSSDEVDDWRELMPDNEDEHLSGVYDAFELALYADPEDFPFRQGLYVGYALMLVPTLAASGLWLVGMVATGQITMEQLGAAIQAARTSSSTTSPFAVDPVALGRSLFKSAVLIPTCLGVSLLVKTMLKALAKFREVNR
jgi:hypothetical protein